MNRAALILLTASLACFVSGYALGRHMEVQDRTALVMKSIETLMRPTLP